MIRIYPDLKKSSEDICIVPPHPALQIAGSPAPPRLDPDPGIVPQQLHLFPLPYAYSSFSSLSELARVGDPSSIGYDGVASLGDRSV